MKKFADFVKMAYFCIPKTQQGRSSVGSERLSHIQEVIGSTPIVPTKKAVSETLTAFFAMYEQSF